MQVLQILALPSLRLRLLKKLENDNTYIVNSHYKCQSMGECNLYTLNCDSHYIHQQNKILIIFLNVLILHYLHPKTHLLRK